MPEDVIEYVRTEGELAFSRQGLTEVVEAILARGASFRFQAHGWSMAPFIRDGDALTLSPLSGAPHLGDVVGFVHPFGDRLVVHRVIGQADSGWILRGDNNPEAGGPVNRLHILGRVTRVESPTRTARVGLGPERLVIAWLSSRGRLQSTLAVLRRLFRRFIRTDGHGE